MQYQFHGTNRKPWIYPVRRLVTSNKVGQWCQIPYPGHPKGCPNFGKSKKCPPQAPSAGSYFDLERALFFIHSDFDLDAHTARMAARHPTWSEKQCRCVLYWQSTSRKQLKSRVAEAVRMLETNAVTMIPEAMGVNVYATARAAGLTLEPIKSLTICRHIALIGSRLKGQMSLF